MAVYRCEVKRVSRSSGRSSVAAAAYRAADRLTNERDGTRHDYRRRGPGVVHAELFAPDHAPSWAQQRGRLWNAAEKAENRKNSVTAREIILNLPHELDDRQRVELTRNFASRLVERYGVAVDMSIHRPDRKGDQRNHHAHLLMTTRRMGREGLGEKTRELDDKARGPQEIEAIRELWENEQNRALQRANVAERVDRRSLKERGIEREPQPKIGEAANALMRRGEHTRIGERWKEVADRNAMKENAARVRAMRTQEEGQQEQHRATMRENMARQRAEKIEREKQEAIERALKAAEEQRKREEAEHAAAVRAAQPQPLTSEQRAYRSQVWRDFYHERHREVTRLEEAQRRQTETLRQAHERELQPSTRQGPLAQVWNRLGGRNDKDDHRARLRIAQQERERREQHENHRKESEQLRDRFEAERKRLARFLMERDLEERRVAEEFERLKQRTINDNQEPPHSRVRNSGRDFER